MKKKYIKPEVEVINLDNEISLLMSSTPPQDPPQQRDWDDSPTSGPFDR